MTSIIVIGKVLQKNINLLVLRKDYKVTLSLLQNTDLITCNCICKIFSFLQILFWQSIIQLIYIRIFLSFVHLSCTK